MMVVPTNRNGPVIPPGPRPDTQVVRVAIYLRRSTDGENQPYSIEAQLSRLLPYIQSQPGWVLTERYADDKSGATLDRPQLQRALRDARLGKYDVLLVLRLDRLTRSIRGLLDIIDELDRAGVAFRSAAESFDTKSPVGRMTMQLLAVFAEFERAMIIERVINGMEAKASLGGWTGGHRPFGYGVLKDPNTGKSTWLVPNEHAGLIPIIFDKYLSQRQGTNAIARWLTQQGHRTQNGKPWSHRAVLEVLRNRAYIGEVHFRGTWHQAPHPHLVSRATFDAAQQLLQERGEDLTTRRREASDYLLAGLMTCANCGKRYLGNAAHGRSRRYRYYTCFTRHRYGQATCPADTLPAEDLETAVLDALLSVYQTSRLMDRAVSQLRDRASSNADQHHAELAAVSAQLRQLDQAIDRYYAAFERGTLSATACARRVSSLQAQQQQLRAREREIGDTLDTANLKVADDHHLAELRSQVALAIRTGDRPLLKELLKTLVASLTVEGRHAIYPVFRVLTGDMKLPQHTAVRNHARYVDLTGLEPWHRRR